MLVEKLVLYVSDVASLLGVSCYVVYQLIHSGQLFAYKIPGSRSWHIPAESLQEYIRANKTNKVLMSNANNISE